MSEIEELLNEDDGIAVQSEDVATASEDWLTTDQKKKAINLEALLYIKKYIKSKVDDMKTEVEAAKSELSTAKSELSTAKSELSTAKSELSTAKSEILEKAYPVGAIYMSTANTDPGTLFGGTWSRWGQGRVPVGVDVDGTIFEGETGTATTATYSKKSSSVGTLIGDDYYYSAEVTIAVPKYRTITKINNVYAKTDDSTQLYGTTYANFDNGDGYTSITLKAYTRSPNIKVYFNATYTYRNTNVETIIETISGTDYNSGSNISTIHVNTDPNTVDYGAESYYATISITVPSDRTITKIDSVQAQYSSGSSISNDSVSSTYNNTTHKIYVYVYTKAADQEVDVTVNYSYTYESIASNIKTSYIVDDRFATSELKGGECEHTLKLMEMPYHEHAQQTTRSDGGVPTLAKTSTDGSGDYTYATYGTCDDNDNVSTSKTVSSQKYITTAGIVNSINPKADTNLGTNESIDPEGSDASGVRLGSSSLGVAHNNIQPYVTCYMWKRIA